MTDLHGDHEVPMKPYEAVLSRLKGKRKLISFSVPLARDFFYDLYIAGKNKEIELEFSTEEQAKAFFNSIRDEFAHWSKLFETEYPK